MAPIRIAFIGLSANGVWAHRAHWPYLKQTSKYQIVGICNSSKESSERAIAALGLPASTKAYASPDELAEDADAFDLAVCSVRVDKHFNAIHAIAAKGKQCYVEWPLARTLDEATRLQAAVQGSGNARTIVGLQARAAPIVVKAKQLLAGGAVGRVLGVTVVSSAGSTGAVDPEPLGVQLNDSRVGASMLSVHFGHLLDAVLFALGEEIEDQQKQLPFNALLRTQYPTPSLRLADGSLRAGTRDTPDHVLLQTALSSGALLSMQLRGGEGFQGEPGLRWRVAGDRGELMLTAGGPLLQMGYEGMALRLHDYATGEVQEVDFEAVPGGEGGGEDTAAELSVDGLPLHACNVARVYEAFADGRKERYADWGDATALHALLERMVESSRQAELETL